MSYLVAFGRYLPSRVVTNQELAARLGCDAEWILEVTGIAERRWAPPGETVIDLAVRAAEDCLARANADRSRLAMLIVASGSAERRFPGPAAAVATRLGLGDIPALDLPLASAGSLFGLALADRLARASGDILVVGAEKMSNVVTREPMDRNLAILFGDGAGACLVSAGAGIAGIVDFALHSDGAFSEDLRLEFDQPMVMNGRSVILQASRKIPRAIREVLDRRGVAPGAVDAYLLHQANQNLLDRVAQALDIASERFFSNIARYGNTSSASMLIAAAEWCEQRGFPNGKPVVFAAFGAGFHWGALLAVGS